jgi:hypothetical protein
LENNIFVNYELIGYENLWCDHLKKKEKEDW